MVSEDAAKTVMTCSGGCHGVVFVCFRLPWCGVCMFKSAMVWCLYVLESAMVWCWYVLDCHCVVFVF